MRRVATIGVLLILTTLLTGCHRAPTETERDNRRLVDAILTSITIKNARLLEDNAGRAKARRDAAHLTDEEYRGLTAVIDKARRGDWSGAEKDGYRFRKAHPFVEEGQ
jgi:hypothetical protein